MREIIHHNIEPFALGICCAQPFEGSEQVRYSLAFMDGACQAISMDVIESQKLLGSREPLVCCPKSDGLPNSRPMLTVNRPEFQGPPFVKTEDSAVLRSMIVQFKNAVFFSRTPDPGTLSRSSFAGRTDLLDEATGESIHC